MQLLLATGQTRVVDPATVCFRTGGGGGGDGKLAAGRYQASSFPPVLWRQSGCNTTPVQALSGGKVSLIHLLAQVCCKDTGTQYCTLQAVLS
jgi:hypothetical protein